MSALKYLRMTTIFIIVSNMQDFKTNVLFMSEF